MARPEVRYRCVACKNEIVRRGGLADVPPECGCSRKVLMVVVQDEPEQEESDAVR